MMRAFDNGYENNPKINQDSENSLCHFLVLHNDEVNTFDHVISSLIEVCNHDPEQAEQCALITHYKGQCDVKKGRFELLHNYKKQLIDKGLTATVE